MTFYIPNTEIEKCEHVNVWWFPRDFSQSKFGERSGQQGSNACTLIAVLLAHRCYMKQIKTEAQDQKLSESLISAIGESILEGNEIHTQLAKNGALQHVNMTVPEAIVAAGQKMKLLKEWKSLVYLLDLGETLYENMNHSLTEWNRNPPPRKGSDLFIILIAENRSVLFIFQKDLDKVTLVDSHAHMRKGAVVAQTSIPKLQSLCSWYHTVLMTCYGASPECYELSYLYFKSYASGEMAI